MKQRRGGARWPWSVCPGRARPFAPSIFKRRATSRCASAAWSLTRSGGADSKLIRRTSESCVKSCAPRTAWRRWRRSRCLACSRRCWRTATSSSTGSISFSEYKLLDENLGAPLVLVAIAAPRHLRYRRLAARSDRPLTPSEARERDLLEIERLEKGGPIALADYTLLNEGAPADLLGKLDGLLDALGFTP